MKGYSLRHAGMFLILCLTLGWQAPAWAGSRRDQPLVMGPDGASARPKAGTGPLVMELGSGASLKRAAHRSGKRMAARSGRRGRARFAVNTPTTR